MYLSLKTKDVDGNRNQSDNNKQCHSDHQSSNDGHRCSQAKQYGCIGSEHRGLQVLSFGYINK